LGRWPGCHAEAMVKPWWSHGVVDFRG
jgi:hypothetical protein